MPRKSAVFSPRGSQGLTTRQAPYVYNQSTSKRHDYEQQVHNGTLNGGQYIFLEMLKFKRSFNPAAQDEEDTPTDANNYQTASVMNGSKIVDYQTRIRIINRELTNAAQIKSFFLDVYQIALSFWDAKIWQDIDVSTPQTALVSQNTSAASFEAGEVDERTPHPVLSPNTVKNFRFHQRYMQKLGTVEIPSQGSNTISINRVPAKCRRANNGMYWALVFHNADSLNGANQIDLTMTQDVSFKEIPSERRLPYVY